MSNETETVAEGQETKVSDGSTNQSNDSNNQSNGSDTSKLSERIKYLETDKENLIKSEKALKAKLKSIEEDKLKSEGKTQELLDSKIKEVEDLQLRLQGLEKIKEEKEKLEDDTRKELLTGLTKEQRDFLKDKPISDIRKARELFGVKSPVDVDSGTGISKNGDVIFRNSKDQTEAETMGLDAAGFYELKRREKAREEEKQERFNNLNKGIKL